MAEARRLDALSPQPGSLLTPKTRPVVDAAIDLLRREARQHSLTVRKIEVSEFFDPEEGDHQIVVRQWLDTEPQVALDYWDSLDAPLQAWIDTLPSDLQSIANNELTVSVRWNHDRPI
jgi:hypothetical protein